MQYLKSIYELRPILIGLKFIRMQEMGLIFQKCSWGSMPPTPPPPPKHCFTPAALAYFAPVALVHTRLHRSRNMLLLKTRPGPAATDERPMYKFRKIREKEHSTFRKMLQNNLFPNLKRNHATTKLKPR